jgi:RNase P subunit RPR2
MEFKTPFLNWYSAPVMRESFCPKCDALMTVELEDPKDPKGDLIQVCKICGWIQEIKEK